MTSILHSTQLSKQCGTTSDSIQVCLTMEGLTAVIVQ